MMEEREAIMHMSEGKMSKQKELSQISRRMIDVQELQGGCITGKERIKGRLLRAKVQAMQKPYYLALDDLKEHILRLQV